MVDKFERAATISMHSRHCITTKDPVLSWAVQIVAVKVSMCYENETPSPQKGLRPRQVKRQSRDNRI